MKKLTNQEIALSIFNQDGLRFINGKWFKNTEEILNINYYLMGRFNFNSISQIKDVIDFIKILSEEDETLKWPEMKIITYAKNYKTPHEMAFPLNNKQLMIINRLLMQQDEKMFIVYGCGGSGKSTFLNIVKQIFNAQFASLNLEQLSNEFTLAKAVGKRLICSDELNGSDLNNAVLKTIISRQPVMINPKNMSPYQATINASLLFSCNKAPRIDISDTGMIRRVCYYEMNQKIKDPDPSFQKQVYNFDDLVNIVWHALQLDTKDWEKLFEQETREILTKNNSVYLGYRYYKEVMKVEKLGYGYDYSFYKSYCQNYGYKAYNLINWNEIKEQLIEWNYIEGEN